MAEKIMVECAYCDHRGELGNEIEIRNEKFVCADVQACDKREAALNPGEDDG